MGKDKKPAMRDEVARDALIALVGATHMSGHPQNEPYLGGTRASHARYAQIMADMAVIYADALVDRLKPR